MNTDTFRTVVVTVLGTIIFTPVVVAATAPEVDRVTTVAAPDQAQPVVARVDHEGTIHLLSDSPNGPKYARSTDNGQSFSAALPVVVEAKGSAPRPAGLEYSGWDLAVGKGGRIHVALGTNAWKLKRPHEEWGYFYTQLAPGSNAFSPVRNLNHKPSEGFSIAADDRGNVSACWLADKLYANVSHDNGKTFADTVELNTQYDPCNCCTTSATYGEDGRLALLYREETNNERDMHLILWDQTNNRMTRRTISRTKWKVDACPMSYYTVARASGPGEFVAVWPTKGKVYFSPLDSQGVPTKPGEIETPGESGMRTGMVALSGPDGSTLVAWNKDDRIGWQFYDVNGSPTGSPGSVPSAGKGVAGVVSKDGRFIIIRGQGAH